MSLRRRMVNFVFKGCGLRKLHDTRAQRFARAILDEIDLQQLRDAHPCPSFPGREEMYQYVHETCVNCEAMDYLEFGVFQGNSIKCWSRLNRNQESRFYGFDSFEGLPETWRNGQGKGHFNVGGALPQVDDSRITFVKGWFDHTVPPFAREFKPRSRLVMHLDADLYGSTMLPLLHFGPSMSKGTLLLFDEFYDREHEFKAFMDWLKIYKRTFRMVAEVGNFAKVCAQLR